MSRTPRRAFLPSLAAFLVAVVSLVAWLSDDLRPQPLYRDHRLNRRTPVLPVVAGRPLSLAFRVPEPAPDRILIPVVIREGSAPLDVSIRTRGDLPQELRTRFEQSGQAEVRLAGMLAGSDQVELAFSSDATELERSPLLRWAKTPPRYDAIAKYGADTLEELGLSPATGPLVMLEFPWPSARLLWAWLIAPFVVLWSWQDRRRVGTALVVVALLGTTTSALLWQSDYSRSVEHLDADDYGHSAELLARYLVDPADHAELRQWFRDYPHATTSLAPVLMALPIALGAPGPAVYLVFSATAGFLGLWLVFWMLESRLGVDHRSAMLTTLVFGTHLALLWAFARPVTDMFGLLLVLVTLALLLLRLERSTPFLTLALATVALCHPLARPQGWSYWVFLALAVVACDVHRLGRWPGAREVARGQLGIFALPLALLSGLYLHFDWFRNVELMLAKAELFRASHTWWFFRHSLLGVVQLLPLLWLGVGERRADRRLWLFVAWLVFYLVMLVAVRAPLWMRHFLPILPSVCALAGVGLAGLGGARRQLAVALLLATVAYNVGVTTWLVHRSTEPPRSYSRYITTP